MWIIKKGKETFMCTNQLCETTEHFLIESRVVGISQNIYFICTVCKAEYNINDVVEWGD